MPVTFVLSDKLVELIPWNEVSDLSEYIYIFQHS